MPRTPNKPPRRAASPRMKHTKVKTARGRKGASTRWLQRQLNDPYVTKAKAEGYRSRAAYKLLELDAQFRLLKPGMRIVDLGAAPGGWTQVAAEAIGAEEGKGRIVAADLLSIDPMPGATMLQLDFLTDDAPGAITTALDGPADLVMSDMAPSFTGHRNTDHLRNLVLAEAALELALQLLSPGGHFLCKLIQGSGDEALLKRLRQHFTIVKQAKPPASRDDSSERFVIAMEFHPDTQNI